MLAWMLALLLLFAAWPWARWLAGAGDEADSCLLPALLTLALGSGALTLGMFWLGLVGVPFTLTNTSLLYLLVMAPGMFLWWRSGHPLPQLSLPASRLARATMLLLLPLCLGILFNSVWWPFSRPDAVAIYERFSLEMLASGTLVPLPGAQTLYEAYPIHIPLGYTWSYLAAGWPNEFLARLFATLPALGCLGAVWALARNLRNRMTAALATLLLAFAPMFGNWASSGYVDLPAAFFTMLALLFVWQLWHRGRWQDALLAGLLCGLAAWTKNAGLISCVMLALWLLVALLRGRVQWQQLALALGAAVLVAGPWYLRNLLEAGLLFPDTAWTEQARPTLGSALILFTQPGSFGLVGILMQAGLLLSVAQALRARRLDMPTALLLWWALPWFAVWWLFASYDPRFVLLFMPLLAVIAALRLEERLNSLPRRWRKILLAPAALLALAVALQAGLGAVDYKDEILRDPLMSIEERRELVWSERQPERLETEVP